MQPTSTAITARPVHIPRWLPVALGEIGIVEDPRVGKSNPRVELYHSATRGGRALDDVPWCASYACWVLEQCGIRSPRSKRAADFATWGQPCIDLTPDGKGGFHYAPGALVVFGKEDPDAGGSGHVAFALGRSLQTVYIVGGNQTNAVTIAQRSTRPVIAVRWPDAIQLPATLPPPVV